MRHSGHISIALRSYFHLAVMAWVHHLSDNDTFSAKRTGMVLFSKDSCFFRILTWRQSLSAYPGMECFVFLCLNSKILFRRIFNDSRVMFLLVCLLLLFRGFSRLLLSLFYILRPNILLFRLIISGRKSAFLFLFCLLLLISFTL